MTTPLMPNTPDWVPATHAARFAPGTNPLVTCACGRTTNADMLLDLSAVSGAVIRQLGLDEHVVTGLCDGCCERLLATNPQARQTLLTAMGAPHFQLGGSAT